MLPGPDQVLECPSCGRASRQPTVSFGSTLDAIYYTDGYMDAPTLPQPTVLLLCPGCRTAFLAREATVVGAVDRFDYNSPFPDEASDKLMDPAWKRAPRVGSATAGDYMTLLASRELGREDEIELRVELMQVCNHRRRKLPRGAPRIALSVVERSNLKRLAARLDLRDAEERVMLAEVRRELGEFEQAAAALLDAVPEEVGLAAGRIRELTEARDPWVAEILAAG